MIWEEKINRILNNFFFFDLELSLGTNHGNSAFFWNVLYTTHSFKSFKIFFQEWYGLSILFMKILFNMFSNSLKGKY